MVSLEGSSDNASSSSGRASAGLFWTNRALPFSKSADAAGSEAAASRKAAASNTAARIRLVMIVSPLPMYPFL